ncbi:uncharacterized protein LOC126898842 [Daktulosphaira vitifoliae]|uniref:uncharacterized protein LOC126898842 n=1 Tax=Daktulosphaira vitifoliae TaxID=58002 RepID=UPI0021A98D42|nr:uncharacterized protein LOC126898842 [Daktulosphaira vitifoliae]
MIDSSSYTIAFNDRKFLQVGLNPKEDFNVTNRCLALPKGTTAVVRFDKFEWGIHNKFGKTNEVYISQFNGSDFFNIAMTFYFDCTLQKLSFEIIKCKEHYIDCVNYRTFEVSNICGKEKTLLYFINMGYANRELSCMTKKGSLIIKNTTLSANNIVGSFALSLDKWWEKSWKWQSKLFSNDNSFFVQSNGQLRFLLLSRRTPPKH